jgi:hypothetical protein
MFSSLNNRFFVGWVEGQPSCRWPQLQIPETQHNARMLGFALLSKDHYHEYFAQPNLHKTFPKSMHFGFGGWLEWGWGYAFLQSELGIIFCGHIMALTGCAKNDYLGLQTGLQDFF